jgi:hypothetical protein
VRASWVHTNTSPLLTRLQETNGPSKVNEYRPQLRLPAQLSGKRRSASSWGTLVAAVTENGFAYAADSSASPWGPDIVIPCGNVAVYVSTAVGFKSVPYDPSGPNSNSFIHWFVDTIGLAGWYDQNPPPGSKGW